MPEAFAAIALLILVSAAVALSLRNLVRSVLLFTVTWAGVAAFYLWAGAEFAAFAQVLVYVGAVSVVALFAVLLTRAAPEAGGKPPAPISAPIGSTRTSASTPATAQASAPPPSPAAPRRSVPAGPFLTATLVGSVLVAAIIESPLTARPPSAPEPAIGVRDLGLQLMNDHPVALLTAGVLLTVALLGGVVIASTDRKDSGENAP